MEINVGTVVRLKSGSPEMTVEYLSGFSNLPIEESIVKCVWFVENREPKRSEFPYSALEISK